MGARACCRRAAGALLRLQGLYPEGTATLLLLAEEEQQQDPCK